VPAGAGNPRQERTTMTTDEQAKAAQEAEAKAQAAAAAAATSGTEDLASVKAQLEKERAERRAANAEAQKFRKLVREQEELKKKAEEEALAKSGQFKELAESREKRAKELETELEQSRAKLAEFESRDGEERQRREAQVAAEFDALPEDVRADIPADADLRMKEIAVRTYQKATASAKPKPPTTTVTTPRPGGSTPAGLLSPDDEARCAQTLGNPRASAKETAEARSKLAAHNAARASGR
jgi:hypothetical protein